MPAPNRAGIDHPVGLKDWFSRLGGVASPAGVQAETGTSLAIAALLVEVLRADYDVGPAERQEVVRSVAAMLGTGPDESQALVAAAERHIDQAHDLFQFTSQINRSCSDAEKMDLLEALWRVAQADSVLHKYEEHMIRRVADLLHVPHRGFITAKLRAAGELQDD